MRKLSVKNKSKSRSKDIPHPPPSYKSNIIQTQTGAGIGIGVRSKSSHRQPKHRSELQPIQELPFGIMRKAPKKENGHGKGHQRKLSKISQQSGRNSDSKAKTFRQHDQDYNLTSNDFECLYVETAGLDGVLTSRNKPQLPTNIAQLNCFKAKNININGNVNISIQQQERKTVAIQKEWNEKRVPYPPKEVVKHFNHLLSSFEKEEIVNYANIYYIAHNNDKKFCPKVFDNEQSEYVYTLHDHIDYRYEILRFLGKGSYGQVFRVLDHKTKKQVAIKMIKNKKKYAKQAQIQIGILNNIKKLDPNSYSGIVEIYDSFVFRKHQCIVFQLLYDNLYQVVRSNNFVGLNLQLIKRFSIQILNSLFFLKENRILHCDLKPENILLVEPNKARIKLIDFGSSCVSDQILYEYIQSRYYRAPEITLGIPYDQKIDMWSFACIAVELYTGMPLFPGNSEEEQIGYMVQSLGYPSSVILKAAKRRKVFFDQSGELKIELNTKRGQGNNGKKLGEIVHDRLFLDFLQRILKWNPQQRLTPKQALQHQWIVDGLPAQIKNFNSLFKEKSVSKQSKSKQLKENKPKPKQSMKVEDKYARQVLCAATHTRNKSVPSKQIKSKPVSARKENHFFSIYRERSVSMQK